MGSGRKFLPPGISRNSIGFPLYFIVERVIVNKIKKKKKMESNLVNK